MQVEAQHAAIIWTKHNVSLTRIGSISEDWIDCMAGDYARWALIISPNPPRANRNPTIQMDKKIAFKA